MSATLVRPHGQHTLRIAVRANGGDREITNATGLSVERDRLVVPSDQRWLHTLGAMQGDSTVELPPPFVEWTDGERVVRWPLGSDETIDRFAAFADSLPVATSQAPRPSWRTQLIAFLREETRSLVVKLVIDLCILLLAAIVVLHQTFAAPEGDRFVTFCFLAFGAFLVVPIFISVVHFFRDVVDMLVDIFTFSDD